MIHPLNLTGILRDLESLTKQEKVKMTPEVKTYVREGLEAAQAKLARGEQLTEGDLEFASKVQNWMSRPDWWRDHHLCLDPTPNEYDKTEAKKRNITLEQWVCLLDMAIAKGEDGVQWIEKQFEFRDDGNIWTRTNLDLRNCSTLSRLPENLRVISNPANDWIYRNRFEVARDETPLDLVGCTGLTGLPETLSIEGGIFLSNDLQKQVIQDAKSLRSKQRIDHILFHQSA